MRVFPFDRIKVLVTSNCNLSCKHCYQHFEKNKYTLSKEQVFGIIDFAVKHNTRIIDFSGGEFFLHPNAYEIIDYCYDKKIAVNIATNAVCIRTELLKKYRTEGFLKIQVSVDGMKKNHEIRRGAGSWDKMIQHVEELFMLDIPITANMVLDKENYLDALSVLKLPYFSEFSFSPLAYVGATTIYSSIGNQKEYEEVVCYLMKEFDCEENDFSKQIFPYVLSIKYDGGIYISPIASDYDMFCFGNINYDSLENICNNYYQSKEFKALSQTNILDIEECNNCKVSGKCDRGSRLRALKYFGDILRPDPFFCRILLNEYTDIPIDRLFWGIK